MDVPGCVTPPSSSRCHPTNGKIQKVQPFPPPGGPFTVDCSIGDLKQRVHRFGGDAYSYIIRSVTIGDDGGFKQGGSGPNFQGGRLTLCTCMHQMRAARASKDWSGVWIAGVTSRTLASGNKLNWLVYLAKVNEAYESYADLWKNLSAEERKAKAADRNYLGDVFQPKEPVAAGRARFSPSNYVAPLLDAHIHRQTADERGWRKDIDYRRFNRRVKHPAALLVCVPASTFIWTQPTIYVDQRYGRGYRRSTLQETLKLLEPKRP
jgi:hypothetical protein